MVSYRKKRMSKRTKKMNCKTNKYCEIFVKNAQWCADAYSCITTPGKKGNKKQVVPEAFGLSSLPTIPNFEHWMSTLITKVHAASQGSDFARY